MRAPRKQSSSDIYHVIARGVGRHILFEDDKDRTKYLDLLHGACAHNAIELYAWCLMDNHVHLLVCASLDAISSAMRSINSTYALYFNKRHDHVGHLFQGRFKSEPVESNTYLLDVLRYIHQNPQKAGFGPSCDYHWSSYQEYVDGPRLCNTDFVLDLFGSLDAFEKFHELDGGVLPCMTSGPSLRYADEDTVRKIAEEAVGRDTLESIASVGREERDAMLLELKRAGLSVRQIERLTGVGRNIVSRIRG